VASPTPVAATPVAVEAGALERVRAGTVTVLAWRGNQPTLASGWVIDREGRIATAAPAVAGAERVEVVAADGRRQEAGLLGVDPPSGLALLGAEGLAVEPLRPGGPVEPGRPVVAVGTAEGDFPGTLVPGLVSSSRRSLPGLYPTTPLIVTAVTLPDGMAGGPLVDEASGEVVGLVVPGPEAAGIGLDVPGIEPPPAIDPPPGIGGAEESALPAGQPGLAFAVPIATVERVVADLIDQAPVEYPYLGAAIEPVDAVAASRLGLPTVGGAVVLDVVAGGPAQEAGIEPGDVLVGFAGEPIGSDRPIGSLLAGRAPGETVALEVVRNGDRIEVEVVLGERPRDG